MAVNKENWLNAEFESLVIPLTSAVQFVAVCHSLLPLESVPAEDHPDQIEKTIFLQLPTEDN